MAAAATATYEYYFGDPCYVLDGTIYDVVGKKLRLNSYMLTYIETSQGTIMVSHTAEGDGLYPDTVTGASFGVDSGCLALIPWALVSGPHPALGRRLTSMRPLKLEMPENGVFHVVDDTGRVHLNVDTRSPMTKAEEEPSCD